MKAIKHFYFLLLIITFWFSKTDYCFSQYHEGDTLKFWSVTYNDWPPLIGAPQWQVNAICKKAGDHCYVFVEDSATQPSQSIIDTMVQRFDHHFYDSLTYRYGPVPNVFDNDPHVFILIMHDPNWAGYFDPGQQMSDSMVYATWNRHSNMREIIYLSSDFINSGSVESVAHEFGHMLHWQQDHSPEPISNPVKYWEDTWVDEGFSTFAAVYLTKISISITFRITLHFFSFNPDIPLIYFSDYDQVKLFMLFMYEHYGKWNYISKLISNQLNGIDGVDSTLHELNYPVSFDDAFEQWAIANFADDSVYAGGKYSYAHYRFSSLNYASNFSSFPTGTQTATVTPYGADYIDFYSSVPKPIKIDFNGQSDTRFRIDFVLKNTATHHIDTIIGIPPDNLNHVSFIAEGLGSDYNQVIMIVMNVDSTIHENNTASYTYAANNYTDINENQAENKIIIFPNPAKDKLNIVLSNDLNSTLIISDMQGRTYFNKNFCNSAEIDMSGLANGVYELRIINKEGAFAKKIVKE